MLAVVSCYFNPAGYASHVAKYKRFRQALPKCNYFCIEASFDGNFVTDSVMRIHANECNFLWQKERLLNLAFAQLPSKFDKVVWIDCDLILLDAKWLHATEDMLDRRPVGQPWSHIHYLDPHGRIVQSHPSMCYKAHHPDCKEYGQPGGCWAARREVLADGLIDSNIIGGGDSMQLAAWSGLDYRHFTGSLINDEWYRAFESERPKHWEHVRGSMGTCPSDMLHIYHGDLRRRGYRDRFSVLRENGFDPKTHLAIDSNGLWRWTEEAPAEMVEGVATYFDSRREDDPPLTQPAGQRRKARPVDGPCKDSTANAFAGAVVSELFRDNALANKRV